MSDPMLSGKVITTITIFSTNKKWIQNKTFEKWKKKLKDPLQPDKMAEDTMWISKDGIEITLRYKTPLIHNKLTDKLEEYQYGRDPTQTLERIDNS